MGDKPLEQMKTALESAPNVDCKEVMIREATTIGDDDNYEEWRGGWKYDFSSFSPNTGLLMAVAQGTTIAGPVETTPSLHDGGRRQAPGSQGVTTAVGANWFQKRESAPRHIWPGKGAAQGGRTQAHL